MTDYRFDAFTISTDKKRLNLTWIYNFLSCSSYWAQGRSLATVQRSIDHSLCFGVYCDDTQVGFARVVTDYATFGWLCDVFVLDDYRGQGLGKQLIEYIAAYPELQGILFVLATRDAHDLYEKYGGFNRLDNPEHWMKRHDAKGEVIVL